MGGLIRFLVIGAIIFFGVGEWQGWYLGFPPTTPIFVYKKDYELIKTYQTIIAPSQEITLEGRLRRGSLIVEGYYERSESFQTRQQAAPNRRVFRQEYQAGQQVRLSGTMREGHGIYRVRLVFEDATGLFRLTSPVVAVR